MVANALIFFLVSMFACFPRLDSLPGPEDILDLEIGIYANEDCAHGLEDTVCDMVLEDNEDNIWQLYGLEGHVILLDFSAMWCGPCRNAASTVQEIQYNYGHYEFNYITVLIENSVGETPNLKDVQEWADIYGIESTYVLQGSRDLIDYNAVEGYPITSWPTFVFIARDLTVYYGMYGYNEATIRNKIEEML